uniref:pentraxin-4-like isoform X2 n=1 Tax=Styela clava TaxID=7725 RepID=UPI0019392808|nr:pentraxin-4-like isoform X2 [Styela clava]
MNYKEYFLGVTQSYSTEDDSKTFLTYGQRTYTGADLHIHIGGQHWTTPIKFPSRTEIFICIAFDSESKTVQLYFNGTRTQTKTFDSLKKFPAGGKLQYGAISDESLPNYRACIGSDYVFSNSDGRVEYVEYIKTAPALETATFCMWLTTDSEGAIRGAIGSYTVGDNVDVNIAEGKIINGITSFALGAKGQFRTIPVSLRKNEEYQICLVGDFVFSNTVKSYVNGVFVTKIQFDKIGKMPGGGKIIIGQRQGCLGGCFDAAKAYKGRIRNFNIWTRMLSEEEIRNVVDSNQCPSDHVVDLRKGNAIFRRLKKEIVTQLPHQIYSIL